MPLAGNKGEFKGNVYFGGEDPGIQSSYAIDSHFVLLIDASGQNVMPNYVTYNNVTYNSNVSNLQANIGGGYFEKLGNSGRF